MALAIEPKNISDDKPVESMRVGDLALVTYRGVEDVAICSLSRVSRQNPQAKWTWVSLRTGEEYTDNPQKAFGKILGSGSRVILEVK